MSCKQTTPLRDDTLAAGRCSTEVRRRILGDAHYFQDVSPEALDEVTARFCEQHYRPLPAIP